MYSNFKWNNTGSSGYISGDLDLWLLRMLQELTKFWPMALMIWTAKRFVLRGDIYWKIYRDINGENFTPSLDFGQRQSWGSNCTRNVLSFPYKGMVFYCIQIHAIVSCNYIRSTEFQTYSKIFVLSFSHHFQDAITSRLRRNVFRFESHVSPSKRMCVCLFTLRHDPFRKVGKAL